MGKRREGWRKDGKEGKMRVGERIGDEEGRRREGVRKRRQVVRKGGKVEECERRL